MSNADLIELFDEAIGNAKCIGRLDGMWQGRGPWPEQDYREMVALEQANSSKRKKLSDALAAADKRIAELEAERVRIREELAEVTMDWLICKDRIAELEQVNCSRLDEAERKLAVAREALKAAEWNSLDLPEFVRVKIAEALAQIGGE